MTHSPANPRTPPRTHPPDEPVPALEETALVGEILTRSAARLAAAGIPDPRREARILLTHAAASPPDRPDKPFHIRQDETISRTAHARFQTALARRLQREPISRILGQRGFWRLDFALSPATLDPRPDSETLIEAALDQFPDRDQPLRILDLGVGTGCLILSVLAEYPRAHGVGVDIDPACLTVAARNAAHADLAGRVEWRAGDWARGLDGCFDLILCNPPYIPSRDIAGLEPEVAIHDPTLALDGGPDGLGCYHTVLGQVGNLLGAGSVLLLEIGFNQGDSVEDIAIRANLTPRARRRDLTGRERCLILTRT